MEKRQAKKLAQRHCREAYQLQTAGQYEDAIDLYHKSIEVFPTAEAHTFLGWTYSFQGRYQDAIRECKRAIQVDPDFGNPYNDIGAYLLEQGQYEPSIPWFEKAIQAKRYDSPCYPHYNLGRVYEKKGDWKGALDCYQRSVESNQNYTLAVKALNRLTGLFN